jgi:glycosyltransferase involved in cell wall biosynthesis
VSADSDERRLAVVAPSWELGGAERYLKTITLAATNVGWQVHVGLPGGAEGLNGFFDDPALHVHRLDVGAQHAPGKASAGLRLAADLARTIVYLGRLRPSLVLINLPTPMQCLGALLAAALLRLPCVVVFQLIPTNFDPTPRRRRLFKHACGNATLIAVSEDNRRRLSATLTVEPSRIVRIFNGVRIGDARTTEQRRAARAAVLSELQLGDDVAIVLTIARLSGQKAPGVILDAAPRVWQGAPHTVFVWAGDGPLRESLASRIQELGWKERVRLLGERTDVASLLAAADLFLFPSWFEGLPLAVVEAMAAGTPVLVSDLDVLRELVGDRCDGLVFDLVAADHMASTLVWALGHPHEMADMAANARRKAVACFGEERMITRTLDVLAQRARSPRHRRWTSRRRP